MHNQTLPVLELRQYTMQPGQRDVLIEIFERVFLDAQEALGIRVLGQFRDLDDPDRFVWLRAFPDMPARAAALTAFYECPVWKANRERANATIIDSDDVMLLRPLHAGSGFALSARRPAAAQPARAAFAASVYLLEKPLDRELVRVLDEHFRRSAPVESAPPIALYETEPAENTYPRLPVRTGEHALVVFAASGEPQPWPESLRAELTQRLTAPPQHLRLAPTPRSLLGSS